MSDYHPRPPGVNATELQARPVAPTAPTDGQVLTWDHATQSWLPGAGGGGGGVTSIAGTANEIAASASTGAVTLYLSTGPVKSLAALAASAGWLHNDGAGTLAYSTPSKSDVGLSAVTNDAQTKASIVPNTAPSAGQILAGNAGGTAYAPVSMSGDATLSSAGALTLAAAQTHISSLTAPTGASLTLTGGDTGASLVIGKAGTTRAFTLTPVGTSLASWATTGAITSIASATITDSSGAGTRSTAVFHSIAAPTLVITNASTVTDAATLYISGNPIASTGATITNSYGLWNAGKTRLDGDVNVGGIATLATTLIYPSTNTTGWQHYNTADQTTNKEYATGYWSGNIFYLVTERAGSTTDRAIAIGWTGSTIGGNRNLMRIHPRNTSLGTGGYFDFYNIGTISQATGNVAFFNAANPGGNGFTNSSGRVYMFRLAPIYNQTGTAATTDFLIDRTESALGSGTHNFLDLQVASVSKFSVSRLGTVTIADTTASTSSTTGALIVAGGVGIAGAVFTAGAITTAAPSGGTAAAWKLGVRVAATVALDVTQYIQLDVGGTLYKLAIAT